MQVQLKRHGLVLKRTCWDNFRPLHASAQSRTTSITPYGFPDFLPPPPPPHPRPALAGGGARDHQRAEGGGRSVRGLSRVRRGVRRRST